MSFIFPVSPVVGKQGASELKGDVRPLVHSELPTAAVAEVRGGPNSMWHGAQRESFSMTKRIYLIIQLKKNQHTRDLLLQSSRVWI